MKKKLPGWAIDLIGIFSGGGIMLLSFLSRFVFKEKTAEIMVSFLISFGFLTSFAFLVSFVVRSIKALRSDKKEEKKRQDSSGNSRITAMVVGGLFVILSLFDALSDTPTFATIALLLWIPAVEVFLVVLIIRGVKAFAMRIKGGHIEPSARAYKQADSGVRVDNLEDGTGKKHEIYVYNQDETFRFNRDAAPLSWGFVFLLLVLLFPFGVYCLIVKTLSERARAFRNGTTMLTAGIVALIPSLGFILLIAVTGADSLHAFLAVTAAPAAAVVLSIALAAYGAWLKHRGEEEDNYRSLITVEGVTNIDTLAEHNHTDYAHVSTVIDRLINAELLGDAYLSHEEREVIVPGISQKIARRCPSCGGTTVLFSNEPQICEYCGGTI